MLLTIIALILFMGLVACWVILPADLSTSVTRHETDPVSPSSVRQPA